MAETTTRLKLKYGEIEFEIEGSSETVERERQEFQKSLISAIEVLSKKMYVEPANAKSLNLVNTEIIDQNTTLITCNPSTKIKKYVSFNQLIKEKRFNTDVDRVLGAAYFIEMCQGNESFTKNDILEQFKKAKLKTPSNISVCIAKNVEKAFVQNVGNAEKGLQLYSLLADGISYCENFEPKEDMLKAKKSPKVSTSSKDYQSLNITVDDLHMENYCNITNLTKVDEQLWVLIYMYTKETNFNIFTKKELQRIMKEKFNLPLSDRQVRRFFEQSGTNVYKTKIGKEQAIRLLQGGFKKAEDVIKNNKT